MSPVACIQLLKFLKNLMSWEELSAIKLTSTHGVKWNHASNNIIRNLAFIGALLLALAVSKNEARSFCYGIILSCSLIVNLGPGDVSIKCQWIRRNSLIVTNINRHH
ncbi:hypothetical protein ACKWTF_012299 [Chironomus riparius]